MKTRNNTKLLYNRQQEIYKSKRSLKQWNLQTINTFSDYAYFIEDLILFKRPQNSFLSNEKI